MADPGSCILVTNPAELHHLRMNLSADNVKLATDQSTIELIRAALLKDPMIRTTPSELAQDLWALQILQANIDDPGEKRVSENWNTWGLIRYINSDQTLATVPGLLEAVRNLSSVRAALDAIIEKGVAPLA